MAETAEQLMFDALSGAEEPTPLLGERVAGPMVEARFEAVVAQARAAVESFFSVKLGDGVQRARALDELVGSLRQSGWEPSAEGTALYTLQFGALLMDAVLRECGGEAVFRSDRDLTHASVFFRATRVELFPFHKAFKAVARKQGEPLAELYEIARQLAAAGSPSA